MVNAADSELPFILSTSMKKADPEMRKLIRSHCMLGKNRGRILHYRRKPMTIQKLLDQGAASAVPKRLGSELSLLRFADSVEPSMLWEALKFISTAKQIFFPLERCFDFNVKDRSMFDLLAFDAAYFNAVVFGAQAYLDLALSRSSNRSSVQMLKTIQLLRNRLLYENEQISVSNPTISIVLTLAHIAHLTGDHTTAEQHLKGLCRIIDLRGGIGAFQNTPKLLTEILRCDISIALHKGTEPVLDFAQIIIPPETVSPPSSAPCLNYYKPPYGKNQYTKFITDERLAEVWDTLRDFCCLVNSAADKNVKLSDQVLLNTMGSVMYTLLRMNFSTTNPTNEAIRLGLLAFCSHAFLERRGIRLPNGYLCENYRACLEDISTQPELSLWFLVVGRLCIFASDTDGSAWIQSRLRENVGLINNKHCSWPQLRSILQSFLWVDMLHDASGKIILESIF